MNEKNMLEYIKGCLESIMYYSDPCVEKLSHEAVLARVDICRVVAQNALEEIHKYKETKSP